MRAFFSHSSSNKDIVIAVYEAFESTSMWLDRAEIEWGELFLERISEGIAAASDFVLFWSAEAARSEWVRLEINMAFIQALRRKAIRLRVIAIDNTPLPLYLSPFQVFSVADSGNQIEDIIEKLRPLLESPSRAVRSNFINRNEEVETIESAIDDPDYRCIVAFGFTGVGKSSLIKASLGRTFEGIAPISLDIQQGTGLVELALLLSSAVRGEVLPKDLERDLLLLDIRKSLETVAKSGRFLVLTNIQHWLSEDGEPIELLSIVLDTALSLSHFSRRPLFLTSTRRPVLTSSIVRKVYMFQVKGLLDKHLAVLIRNWYFNIHGEELSEADAKKIAPKLFGHPIAARLVAGLLGNVKADFLELYPQELISLRRDLARTLLQDVNLDPPSERLMETLALAGIGLPAAVLAASVATEEQFQSAVSQCASAGLITADLNIESHPLFQDFFWHRLHRGDYKTLASNLADAITRHLGNISHSSHEYIALTPVVFRALALSGRMRDAAELRSDLRGELESAAITLYNRRDYALADRYIDQLLDFDPSNWRMRLYRARIRTHQENWSQAEEILDLMLAERPNDAGVLHAFGRLFLKRGSLDEALKTFMRVIAKREHVASLTGAAESLHRMGRNEEALAFLSRAKERESENFFVLDLESRILEDEGELDLAYTAALLASNRDPLHAQLHARLGVISSKRGRPDLAVQHLQRAVQLDPGLFHATHSLASALLDIGQSGEAEAVLRTLTSLAKNPTNSSLVEHLRARLFMAKGDLESAVRTLRRELAGSRNVVPNLGLLVEVQCQLFDREDVELTAIAETHLASAEEALHQLLKMDPNNEFADRLKERVRSRTKA